MTIGPGKLAYFMIAKYRCDTGVAKQADSATVRLPRQSAANTVPAAWLRGLFDLCTRVSPSGPGNTITISPFEPSLLGQ